MEIKQFVPNYLKKGNAYDKNGTAAGSGTKKRTTSIPGAIKTADEVEPRLKAAGKKIKRIGKDTKAKRRAVPGVREPARLSRVGKTSRKAQKPGRK